MIDPSRLVDPEYNPLMIRLGGPLFTSFDTPEDWATAVKAAGYRAAYCPLPLDADDPTVQAYARAAQKADIVIAEVGTWSNPLSRDANERQAALQRCQQGLDLADRIGACCCVNIAGSRAIKWDGPHPDNLTDETFEMIVASVREIIDAVRPTRTVYSLETMPWVFPDSVDSYLRLVQAIDRPAFGVHLDPVNLVCSPQRYFSNGALIVDCFARLGPYIKSCHAKDILLRDGLTTHLDEVRIGLGGLNYAVYLRELHRLPGEIPLMLEHLPEENDYRLAAEAVRAVARQEAIPL
jgi:sugar phosphate isomerase/epimerase